MCAADEAATDQVLPGEPEVTTDPIREILRAKGHLAAADRPQSAPRGEDESMADCMARVSDRIVRGRVFTDDSVHLHR
jgi:hypothetical protein